MERHGHLQLAPEIRTSLLAMSPATIDRALRDVRGEAGGRRRRGPPSAAIRRSVPVRTFAAGTIRRLASSRRIWLRIADRAKGSFVQTLMLTDIATGWTECAPVLVRDNGC